MQSQFYWIKITVIKWCIFYVLVTIANNIKILEWTVESGSLLIQSIIIIIDSRIQYCFIRYTGNLSNTVKKAE